MWHGSLQWPNGGGGWSELWIGVVLWPAVVKGGARCEGGGVAILSAALGSHIF